MTALVLIGILAIIVHFTKFSDDEIQDYATRFVGYLALLFALLYSLIKISNDGYF